MGTILSRTSELLDKHVEGNDAGVLRDVLGLNTGCSSLIAFDIMNSKEPPHYPCTFLNGTRALTQVLYTTTLLLYVGTNTNTSTRVHSTNPLR